MASKAERTIINAAGLVQGIVLATFPAASTIFTDKNEYGLSSTVRAAQGAGVPCWSRTMATASCWASPEPTENA
jgi:hypothetical protein